MKEGKSKAAEGEPDEGYHPSSHRLVSFDDTTDKERPDTQTEGGIDSIKVEMEGMEGEVDGSSFVDSRRDDESEGQQDKVEHEIEEEKDDRSIWDDKEDDGEHHNSSNGERQRTNAEPLPLGEGKEDENGDNKAKEQREGKPDNNQNENKSVIIFKSRVTKESTPGTNHSPDESPPNEPVQGRNCADFSDTISFTIFWIGSFALSFNEKVITVEKSNSRDNNPVNNVSTEFPNADNSNINEQSDSRNEGEKEKKVLFSRTPSEMDERNTKGNNQPQKSRPRNR
mmetsp:Transcript_16599/g.25822  ORF Transcript_16599/g.25822 Transcript_16599/m.25822 type:complete len:283 (+) Transcript_16599:571-1419(+)